VHAKTGERSRSWQASTVLVVTGVRPDTELAAAAGLTLGIRGTIAVDRGMRTTAADVYAAGDCVRTYHRLLDRHVYLPLGSTAHKQGRVAGVNATGGDTVFAGSLGTQVVRVFDRVIAATGLREAQAREAGFDPLVADRTADDHKAYYPGATPLRMRIVGDRRTGRLLGAQLIGRYGAEVAKRVDIFATAISFFAASPVAQPNEPAARCGSRPAQASPVRRRTLPGPDSGGHATCPLPISAASTEITH
jgi:NADPH-dependent 2,4-dienoyl-CoA reductase/sulfur reductase-like enzyme